MRTFSRADWDEAEAAWSDFSDEWQPFRELALRRGILFPPSGTKWDSWEDDSPSQRAILIRAIRETPELLKRCIGRSSSWREVVANLTGERDEWRERMVREPEPQNEQPTHGEAVAALRTILGRMAS